MPPPAVLVPFRTSTGTATHQGLPDLGVYPPMTYCLLTAASEVCTLNTKHWGGCCCG